MNKGSRGAGKNFLPDNKGRNLQINVDENPQFYIDVDIRGVFTYIFCQILRKSNGNIKRSELYKLLIASVKRGGFEQTPQMEL